MNLIKVISKAKKYAKLHGNIQRHRIKSLCDNIIERG